MAPSKPVTLSHINCDFFSNSKNSSKDNERSKKEIYGQLFRSEVLYQIYELCQSSQEADYESALKVLSKKCKINQENAKVLLEKIINILQSARLTINFNFSKIYDINNKWPEVLNCFAYLEKPNEISNYNVGRANIEEIVFYLSQLFTNSEYEKFGRYSPPTGDQTTRSADFQWTSRPCYAALDFLENSTGGAPMYGKSFLILKDYVKHNCTYSPYDTYSPPIFHWGMFKDKISTFLHFPRLIRYCQNDLLWYNCLKSLINKANKREDFSLHPNYGKSVGNYIEAHIYARILFTRDIKQICLSKEEFESHTPSKQKQILEKINTINSRLGFSFIIFNQEEYTINQPKKSPKKLERQSKEKKINPVVNVAIKFLSFGFIDINNETSYLAPTLTKTTPLLPEQKENYEKKSSSFQKDEKKFDKQAINDEDLNNSLLNNSYDLRKNLL